MNIILSALGRLPESNSPQGTINQTDWLKVIRMGLMIAASYASVAIVEALIRSVSNGEFGIPEQLVTPITGVLSLVLEALRRKVVPPQA